MSATGVLCANPLLLDARASSVRFGHEGGFNPAPSEEEFPASLCLSVSRLDVSHLNAVRGEDRSDLDVWLGGLGGLLCERSRMEPTGAQLSE